MFFFFNYINKMLPKNILKYIFLVIRIYVFMIFVNMKCVNDIAYKLPCVLI